MDCARLDRRRGTKRGTSLWIFGRNASLVCDDSLSLSLSISGLTFQVYDLAKQDSPKPLKQTVDTINDPQWMGMQPTGKHQIFAKDLWYAQPSQPANRDDFLVPRVVRERRRASVRAFAVH